MYRRIIFSAHRLNPPPSTCKVEQHILRDLALVAKTTFVQNVAGQLRGGENWFMTKADVRVLARWNPAL